jgi:hypothetical protein
VFFADCCRMFDRFDILKVVGRRHCVDESANDLQTAQQRIKLFAANQPGEFIVFCQVTGAVVASEINKVRDDVDNGG